MLLNIYHRLAGVICLPTCVLTRQTKRGRERLFMGGGTMSGHCEKKKNWLNPSLVMAIKLTGSSREPLENTTARPDRALLFSFFFFCFSFCLNLLDCKYATTFHWRTLNAGRFIVPWTKERFSGAIAPRRRRKKKGPELTAATTTPSSLVFDGGSLLLHHPQ